jgi:hypothetical protein
MASDFMKLHTRGIRVQRFKVKGKKMGSRRTAYGRDWDLR